jgi:hypothetical protein
MESGPSPKNFKTASSSEQILAIDSAVPCSELNSSERTESQFLDAARIGDLARVKGLLAKESEGVEGLMDRRAPENSNGDASVQL